MQNRSLTSFCAIVFLAASLSLAFAADETAVFPTLTATNLAKQKVTLPQDFAGTRNLLLIAFEREQQKDIDTWLPAAKALETSHSTFRYYELDAIGRYNPVMRWYLDASMRSGTPDNAARQRTIPLYIEKAAFRHALDIPSESAVTALLVDKSGKIVWRSTGDFTEEKKANLLAELQAAGV